MLQETNPKRVNRFRVREHPDDPTDTEVLIMLYLEMYQDKPIDNNYLAALCCVDRRIIRRSITNLIKRGWILPISKKKRARGCGVIRYKVIRQIPGEFYEEKADEL